MTGALKLDELAAAKSGKVPTLLDRHDLVLGSMDHEHRTGQLAIYLFAPAVARGQHGIDKHVGCRLQGPGNAVFDLFRRTRLDQAAAHDVLREIAEVLSPVVRVPFLVPLEVLALVEK